MFASFTVRTIKKKSHSPTFYYFLIFSSVFVTYWSYILLLSFYCSFKFNTKYYFVILFMVLYFFFSSSVPYNIPCYYSLSLNVSFPLPFIRIAICLSYCWSLLLLWYSKHVITLLYMEANCRLQLQKKENGIRCSNDLILFWNILEDRFKKSVPESCLYHCLCHFNLLSKKWNKLWRFTSLKTSEYCVNSRRQAAIKFRATGKLQWLYEGHFIRVRLFQQQRNISEERRHHTQRGRTLKLTS